jgi:hypothetical protein
MRLEVSPEFSYVMGAPRYPVVLKPQSISNRCPLYPFNDILEHLGFFLASTSVC